MGKARKVKTAAPLPPPPAPVPPAKRGRPPGEPRTTLARWLREQNMAVTEFAAKLGELASTHGLERYAPQAKTLLDSVNGRSRPGLPVVVLVELATDGAVTAKHWVRDLY